MLLPLLGALAAVNIPRALTPSSSSSLDIAVANSTLRSPCTTLLRQDRLRLGKAKEKRVFLLLCSRLALSLPRDKSGKMKSPDGCRERPGFDTGLGNKDTPGYDSAAACSNP